MKPESLKAIRDAYDIEKACIEEMKSCCDKIKVVGSYNNLQQQKI